MIANLFEKAKDVDERVKQISMGLGILAFLPALVWLNAWAVLMNWNWFMPSIFNLPMLTFGDALGLSCVTSLFASRSNSSSEKESLAKAAFKAFLKPLISIFVGLIVRLVFF